MASKMGDHIFLVNQTDRIFAVGKTFLRISIHFNISKPAGVQLRRLLIFFSFHSVYKWCVFMFAKNSNFFPNEIVYYFEPARTARI